MQQAHDKYNIYFSVAKTKQSDIEMVAKARAWAVKAHAGQKDKAGKDYNPCAGKAHSVRGGMKGALEISRNS